MYFCLCADFCFFLLSYSLIYFLCIFFFNDTATTEIYTLSLHDALPISIAAGLVALASLVYLLRLPPLTEATERADPDRKSTRLNSSHRCISYAVFCLKKKKHKKKHMHMLKHISEDKPSV